MQQNDGQEEDKKGGGGFHNVRTGTARIRNKYNNLAHLKHVINRNLDLDLTVDQFFILLTNVFGLLRLRNNDGKLLKSEVMAQM